MKSNVPESPSLDVEEENVNEDDEYIMKLENVHKTYLLGVEGVPALRGIDLTVKRGEWQEL